MLQVRKELVDEGFFVGGPAVGAHGGMLATSRRRGGGPPVAVAPVRRPPGPRQEQVKAAPACGGAEA